MDLFAVIREMDTRLKKIEGHVHASPPLHELLGAIRHDYKNVQQALKSIYAILEDIEKKLDEKKLEGGT